MRQVVVIHGGDTFPSYDAYLASLQHLSIESVEYFKNHRGWKDTLDTVLGDGYEVLAPRMPNKSNAKYAEWSLWFEKLVPFLRDGVQLVGHSLGGVFLAKYLSAHTLPVRIDGVFLVAAPYGLEPEFAAPAALNQLAAQAKRVVIYHSTDDPVVPAREAEKYRRALQHATVRLFEGRAHFNQDYFPELVTDLRTP